jgi:TRAP-type uncharacterized transport system substrate-binding protein
MCPQTGTANMRQMRRNRAELLTERFLPAFPVIWMRERGCVNMKYLRAYWPVAVLLVIVMFIASRFVAPAPPKTLNFAAGSPSGAYTLTANAYAKVFDEKDFTLEVATTTGSGDNLKMLRTGEVGAAIVQGGIATLEDKEHLRSLGAIFFEPLWVFYRSEVAPPGSNASDVRGLEGLRVAAGSPTSGTRALAVELLSENGVSANLLDLSGAQGAAA